VQPSNIDQYLDQLSNETDYSKRAVLLNLLIDEEDKFAANHEQLADADQRVLEGRLRIKNLESAARLIDDEEHLSRLVALFVTTQDTQRILEHFYQRLSDKLDKS